MKQKYSKKIRWGDAHPGRLFGAFLPHGHVPNPSRDMRTSSPLSDAMGHMPCGICPVSHGWATCPGSHVLCGMSWVTCPVAHVLGRRLVGVRRARRRSGGFGFCGGHVAWVNWPGWLQEDARGRRGAPGSAFGSQWTTPAGHPCAAGSPRCPAMCLGWRLVILVLRLLAPCLRGCICLAA